MIKNLQHAQAVQKRRYDAGKTGMARAVGRWLKRQGAMRGVYKRELFEP